MRKILAVFLTILIMLPANALAYEDTPVNLVIDGVKTTLSQKPVIRDGVTYADVKSLASVLDYSYKWYDNPKSAIISSKSLSICIVPNEEYITVADLTGTSIYEYVFHKLSAPCVYIGGQLCVAVRDFSQIFNYSVNYNKASNTVYLQTVAHIFTDDSIDITVSDNQTSQIVSPEVEVPDNYTTQLPTNHTYYFQNEEEFQLPNFGSGYCWVCSYAMLISNVKGIRVTPSDIAQINLRRTSNGAYCYHYDITSEYHVYIVSALPETSVYYGGRDMISGGTFINNPQKSDAVVRAALIEALKLHPAGVLVRYADFPHTMVAVGFDGNDVLFYDPAPTSSGSYATDGRYKGVTFDQTCVAAKGFNLSDITFMQAITN